MSSPPAVPANQPDPATKARQLFETLFRRPAAHLALAPGRVNVIGEHVDYNGGWVLPAAIDRGLALAVAPRADGIVRLASGNFDDVLEFNGADLAPGRVPGWGRYVQGVLAGLARAGQPVPGFDACVVSCIPIGGGLSSSAALEAATGLAGLALRGASMDRSELARLCRQAEHTHAGVPCGIMDQAAVLRCEAGHLLLLDCESEGVVQVPWPSSDWCLLVINSGVSHELASGEYAQRRATCEQAARCLNVPSLRHVLAVDLDRVLAAPDLTDDMRRCVRHVVTENARTLRCVAALRAGDFRAAGGQLNASHASLRDDYHVSCPELDFIAATAQREPAVAGCRMTGGGFGGSCLALVRREAAEAVGRSIGEQFHARFGRPATSFVTAAAAGARVFQP